MKERKSNPKQRLTLEIEGPEIAADKFIQGVNSFSNLIKDVAKEISGELQRVRWLVDVKSGSIRIDFLPQAEKVPEDTIPSILDAVVDGMTQLESSNIRPQYFSERALKCAHDLASIVDGKDKGLERVRIWRNGKPNQISTKVAAHVDSIFSTRSKDWGTLEGRLSVISERRGLHIQIYDPLTNKPTTCFVNEDILEKVMAAFKHRVSVSGLIRYSSDGEPISIEVKEFSVFPPSEDLPSIDDVHGILGESD